MFYVFSKNHLGFAFLRNSMKIAVRFFLLINLLICHASHAADANPAFSAMRKTFLQAEQYISQNRESDYFALADALTKYPLYPYLQYQWLSKHLDDDKPVQDFLLANPNSRYAPLLH
jgi:soluble lytic murein transglycosylase